MPWHVEAGFIEGPQRAECQLVIAGDDGGELATSDLEKFPGRPVTSLGAPITLNGRPGVQSKSAETPSPFLLSQPAASPLQDAAYTSNPGMAELGEMLGGHPGAGLIIERDSGDPILAIRIHDHRWNSPE